MENLINGLNIGKEENKKNFNNLFCDIKNYSIFNFKEWKLKKFNGVDEFKINLELDKKEILTLYFKDNEIKIFTTKNIFEINDELFSELMSIFYKVQDFNIGE